MNRRRGAAVVLVGALALVAASVAWAVGVARSDSWNGHHFAYGPGMMGLGYTTAKANPVDGIAEARQRAQSFADRLGLTTGEVMRFERNYYVVLVDKHGNDATEVLVDPETGATSLEYGPAMMWNTKYGMMSDRFGGSMNADTMRNMMGDYGKSYGGMMGGGMMGGATTSGGMMGGGSAAPSTRSPGTGVSLTRAHELAQSWLDTNQPGVKVESGGDSFPGYYTLETLRDGRITGMISVNASSGAVLQHWWHGQFIERAD